MPIKDRDLLSVQEARDLVAAAKAAQKVLGAMGQAKVDIRLVPFFPLRCTGLRV